MAFDWQKIIGLKGPSAYGDSTGLGPDFPSSAGDRERGKFRPSMYPRLTTVAISDDEGNPISMTSEDLLAEILLELKAIRLGQDLILETDLRSMVSD